MELEVEDPSDIADPTDAYDAIEKGLGAARANSSKNSERELDITRDWKLGTKEVDEKSWHALIAMTAQLTMQTPLQTKICSSIAILSRAPNR